jgi:hypothetical protein
MAVKGARHLSMVGSAKLVMLIQNEFLIKKLEDSEFATYATEKLGFPVNVHQVRTRRCEMQIPSKFEMMKKEKKTTVIGRIEELEKQVAEMKEKLKDLLN